MSAAILEYVDLYPTRYEAFDKPGVWCVFRAADDGTFWHCRRDGDRSNMADFIAPTRNELAVYYTGVKDEPYAEVRSGRKGYSVECQRAGFGTFLSGFATVGAAIRAACEALSLPVPENCPA